jgi:hypothetical protein
MTVSIADFKASFRTELARPSRFDVFIPIPSALSASFESRLFTFRCESADLPGRALATSTQKIYGPEEKFPYQTTYNDINMTFICTENMIEKVFFDGWLNTINPNSSYDMVYKNTYASDIKVRQYGIGKGITYQVVLYKAFPIGVNDLQLDWSSDGYHKLTVTFAYKEWKQVSDYVPPPTATPKAPSSDSGATPLPIADPPPKPQTQPTYEPARTSPVISGGGIKVEDSLYPPNAL